MVTLCLFYVQVQSFLLWGMRSFKQLFQIYLGSSALSIWSLYILAKNHHIQYGIWKHSQLPGLYIISFHKHLLDVPCTTFSFSKLSSTSFESSPFILGSILAFSWIIGPDKPLFFPLLVNQKNISSFTFLFYDVSCFFLGLFEVCSPNVFLIFIQSDIVEISTLLST